MHKMRNLTVSSSEMRLPFLGVSVDFSTPLEDMAIRDESMKLDISWNGYVGVTESCKMKIGSSCGAMCFITEG